MTDSRTVGPHDARVSGGRRRLDRRRHLPAGGIRLGRRTGRLQPGTSGGRAPDGIDHRQWRRRLLRSRLALIGVLLLGYPPVVLGIFSAGDSRSPVAPAVMWGLALSGLGLFGLVIRRLTRIRQLVCSAPSGIPAFGRRRFQAELGNRGRDGAAHPSGRAHRLGLRHRLPRRVARRFFVHGISGLPDLRWTAAGTAGIVLVVSRLRRRPASTGNT